MPKVLKPELDKSKAYNPYKLYQGLFLKKGHGLQSLFKIYSLAMIWLTLAFGLFASDAVNPSFYLNGKSSMSTPTLERYKLYYEYQMRVSSIVTYAICFLSVILLIAWYSFRKTIYSSMHVYLHYITLFSFFFGVLLEFFGILLLRISSSNNRHAVVTFSRIIYGIGRALHQVSTYKLLSEICEPKGSEPGLMISFVLTSNSFKFAFDQVILLHDWVSVETMKLILLYLGFIMIISVIVYISIDMYHFISTKQLLFENTEQLKELKQIHNTNERKSIFKSFISLNSIYIFVLLCMAILYYFGVMSCPLLEGGILWIEYTHTGQSDLESLKLNIHFIVMVTLPFCGALLDRGSETKSDRKLKKQLEDLKKEGKTQPFQDYESTNVTSRMIYLCLGMIFSIASAFFYIYDRPYLVPMYDWVVNIISCIYSISTAMVLISIFAIPKYIIERVTKLEIEKKAKILKDCIPKHTTKYLYYLHAIFYEQTEISGLRYTAWISIIFLISDLSLNEKISDYSIQDILTLSSILIIVLTLIVLFSFLIVAHYKKLSFHSEKQQNGNLNEKEVEMNPQPSVSLGQSETIHETFDETINDETIIDENIHEKTNIQCNFDASALFCQYPFLLKSKTSLIISLFAWIIDFLMSINLIVYIIFICGVPSILLAFKETTLLTNRQSTHILIVLFLPVLFIFFTFSFYYVYPEFIKRFILTHFFKWTRRFLGLSISPPFTHIRDSIHSSISFQKNSLQLSNLKKQIEEESKNNPKDVLFNIKNMFSSSGKKGFNSDSKEIEMNNENDEYYSSATEYINMEKGLEDDEYVIITVKDDRIQPLEDDDPQKRRMTIQKFSSRQEYVSYLGSEEFNEMFNERDYSFASVTKGTVLFKKSQYRYSYSSESSIRILRSCRPNANFTFYFITFYSLLFMIPHVFSFFGFSTIPNITNPYTFLIITCNFSFGFFMFYPLYAIWLDTSDSMTCSLKEAIIQHDDILSQIKSKPSSLVQHNPETQLKIMLSKNQCLILEKEMLRKWYKKFTFLQKIIYAKMDLLQRNIVFAIVLSKGGSVVLSLVSLFTNLDFNPQTFQPLYIFLGLDIILLYLVIDPCATITSFMSRNILRSYKLIVKIEGAAEAFKQETSEEIETFKKNYHFVKYWYDMRSAGVHGCKLKMVGILSLDIDNVLYKAWYYSLLTTLPPAIFKLIIQQIMAGRGAFRL